MKNYIAENLSLTLLDKKEKSFERVQQFYIIGNFLVVSAIPLLPERGNVLVTERFRHDEISSVLIIFN